MSLTVKRIEKLLRAGVPTKVTDGEVRGLMLCVESQTSAHWLLRYQRDHVTRHMGLGSASEVTLAEARERAAEQRRRLRDGIDPLELKRSERAAKAAAAAKRITFKQASERFLEAHDAGWSGKRTSHEFESSMKRWVWPLIGDMDVAAIDRDAVLRVLEQRPAKLKGASFWHARAITADRVRNRLERTLDFAQVRGWRAEGTPNPARWRGYLDHILPAARKVAAVEHLRSLPYSEVPRVMAALTAADENPVAAAAVRFVIMTACRLGSALGAVWSEIDLDAKTWAIPATKMKARRPFSVPLSEPVLALLRSLPREGGNEHLFIGTRTEGTAITEQPVTRALRLAGCDATLHGFRSSFRTWCSERTGVAREVAEQALAHRVGDATERSYARSDLFERRRRLMEQWARFCTTPPVEKAAVVPLRRPV